MVRDLVKELGAQKAAIAISAVSILISAVLYLILSEIIGDFSSKGLLRSMLIPGVIAPILSHLFLRIYVQLDLAEEEVRKNEERYRSVFENTGTATVIIEQDRTISMANTEFERLSSFTKEEIEGKMKWTKFVVREDLERMTEYHWNRREGLGAPPTEYEFRFIDREGRVKDILNKVSMIPGTRKSVASLLDISERKRMEEDKRELEGRLRQAQKMDALGTLARGIAHDFNNILAAIMGHTELASLQVPQESQVKRSLEGVLKASERAKELIKQIFSFSRQGEQELKAVLIGPIIDEALNLLRATFPPAIDIRFHIDHAGMVKADPSQLHQVMMNLCTNAAHAMGENGGILEVSLTKVDMDIAASHAGLNPGPYVKIAVRDTGSGMAPETMERIFEPYFTTKEKGKGTGLGLAVVHGIVKNHGGSVAVESEPGKGTTFHVFLPVVDT